MLGALLGNIRLVTGTLASEQDAMVTAATGRMSLTGTGASQSSPGETSASAAGADTGELVSVQAAQITVAVGSTKIAGSGTSLMQGKQRTRAAGIGPARQTPRYLRVPREQTSAGRSITLR